MNQNRLSFDSVEGGLNIGKMALTYLLAAWEEGSTKRQRQMSIQPSPWSHTSFRVCLWHFRSCWPSSKAQGKCLRVSESVGELFKKKSGFPAASHLTWMTRILTDFHSQILQGLLFLTLESRAGSPSVGLGPLAPAVRQGLGTVDRSPSWCSTITRGCRTSSFLISAPPTSPVFISPGKGILFS